MRLTPSLGAPQVLALGFVSAFDQLLDSFDQDERAKVFDAYVMALGEDPSRYRVSGGLGRRRGRKGCSAWGGVGGSYGHWAWVNCVQHYCQQPCKASAPGPCHAVVSSTSDCQLGPRGRGRLQCEHRFVWNPTLCRPTPSGWRQLPSS